jgi:hypothetical protein
MLKSVLSCLGLLTLALVTISGVNLSGSPREGLAFGAAASWQNVPAEEPLKLELHYGLSDDPSLSDNYLLHLTAKVSMDGADLPCENVVWYATRTDAFYLSLAPDLRGCSGEIQLPAGEWDIRALFIKDLLSTEKTISLTIPE